MSHTVKTQSLNVEFISIYFGGIFLILLLEVKRRHVNQSFVSWIERRSGIH